MLNGKNRKKRGGRRLAAALLAALMTAGSAITAPAEEINIFLNSDNGWLFLEPAYSIRQQPLLEAECQEITENLLSLQAELADAGIYFVVFIAPDKEEIYGEKMSPAYPLTGADPVEQAVNYLREHAPDLPVVYPKEELLAAKEGPGGSDGGLLYIPRDSHWNMKGGYVGAEALIRTIGEHFGHGSGEIGHTFSDDSLMKCNGEQVEDYYRYADEPRYRLTRRIVSETNGDWVYGYYDSTHPEAWPEKVYFAGDSFRFAAAPALAERFRSLICMNRFYLDLDNLAAEAPDVFVLSFVGRFFREGAVLINGVDTAPLPLTDGAEIYGESLWEQNQEGRWWRDPIGTYPVSSWRWIDDDGDGVCQCYCFDEDGYLLTDTVTPDGYRVDGDGAWVVDGVVQTRSSR